MRVARSKRLLRFRFVPRVMKSLVTRAGSASSAASLGYISTCDALDPRNRVEARVEARNPGDAIVLHQCDMKRVARRELFAFEYDGLGALDSAAVDGPNVVDDSEQNVKSRLNRVSSSDRHIAMQDL